MFVPGQNPPLQGSNGFKQKVILERNSLDLYQRNSERTFELSLEAASESFGIHAFFNPGDRARALGGKNQT